MRSIIYNLSSSYLIQPDDSLALRCAILFSVELTYAGTGLVRIDFEKWCNPLTFEDKLHMIPILQSNQQLEIPIPSKEAIQDLRKIQNRKGKSKEAIVAIKGWEIATNELYDSLKTTEVNRLKKLGLINLKPLLKEDYFHILFNEEIAPEKDNDEHAFTSFSKMLTMEVTCLTGYEPFNSELQSVFFLQPSFVSDLKYFFKKNIEGFNPVQPVCNYTHTLFTLPNLNYATAHEIGAIRNWLKPKLVQFHNQMDTWLKKVYALESDSEDYLLNKVIPDCASIQEQLNNNEMLKHFTTIDKNEGAIEIIAGEIALTDIWKYFESFDAVCEETKNVLDKLKNTNPRYSQSYPLLTTRFTASPSDDNLIQNYSEIKPVKKYLSFD